MGDDNSEQTELDLVSYAESVLGPADSAYEESKTQPDNGVFRTSPLDFGLQPVENSSIANLLNRFS